MANICDNFVTCTGSATNITKFKKVIEDGIQFSLTNLVATSLGVDIVSGYFFEIYLNEQDDPKVLTFSYTTKWAPNLQDLATLAKKHKIGMVCEYNECGMALYGTATIDRHGFINDDEVSAEFIDLLEYNDETGCYEYDGIEYETEGDFINEKYAEWKVANQ